MSRRWGVAAACAAVLATAAPAGAQDADEAASGARFVPRFEFHLGAEHLSVDDSRLVWEANYGGELDLVDYGSGRVTFASNYQVMLGEDRRSFDPEQSRYMLELSAWQRAAGAEFGFVVHHISRHLSDRDKEPPVDWNMAGLGVHMAEQRGPLALDVRGDVRGVFKKSELVDYRWEMAMATDAVYELRPGLSALARGQVRLLGVDGTLDRSTQAGYRVEGGVRLAGAAGGVELFAAVERRVDPFPLDQGTLTWALLGFRFVSP